MANYYMWFGTRDYMTWVPCPAINMPSGKESYQTNAQYLNGGQFVRNSTASAKRYSMSWGSLSRDEARPILDFADKIYGTGAIYFTDPFTAAYNVLPQWFASPSQGLDDGIPLNGGVRGTEAATAANGNGYPVKSINYNITSGAKTVPVWIPIPPGYTAWVGVHGVDGTGGNVQVKPTTGATTYGTTTTLTMLPVTSTTRVNASFAGGTFTGIEIALGGTGTVTLSGIMVQILANGVTPVEGGFISGQGNSGCSFVSQPSYVPYSAALDRLNMNIELVETEGWRVA